MNTEIHQFIQEGWILVSYGDGRGPRRELPEVYLLEPEDNPYLTKEKVRVIVIGDCVVRICGEICNFEGIPLKNIIREKALKKLHAAGLTDAELQELGYLLK